MNQNLVDNNYLVIKNFITPYRAFQLHEDFLDYSNKNNLHGDHQVPLSHSHYNYISFLELLCEKTPEISSLIGETVLPTYAYNRIYKKESILHPHKDRNSCEISVTLHLYGDQPWDIFIETPEYQKKKIILNSGDALIYLGCDAEHWREKYNGELYSQVFLHYVKSRGPNSKFFFDNKNYCTELNIHQNNLLNENCNEINKSNLNEDSENITSKKTNIDQNNFSNENCNEINKSNLDEDDIMKNNYIIKNSNCHPNSNLQDFIVVLDNFVSENLCSSIINAYHSPNEWQSALIGNGENNNNIRNCKNLAISRSEVINIDYDIRKKIDESLYEITGKCIKYYREKFPSVVISEDTGYDLLKYDVGNFYVQHTDSLGFGQLFRSVSCAINLNNNYQGGEFAFFDREFIVRGGTGSVIMFPSNFMYPHEIMPVTEGTRYSIITWFR